MPQRKYKYKGGPVVKSEVWEPMDCSSGMCVLKRKGAATQSAAKSATKSAKRSATKRRWVYLSPAAAKAAAKSPCKSLCNALAAPKPSARQKEALLCAAFKADPTVNPLTGAEIKVRGPKYNEWVARLQACERSGALGELEARGGAAGVAKGVPAPAVLARMGLQSPSASGAQAWAARACGFTTPAQARVALMEDLARAKEAERAAVV